MAAFQGNWNACVVHLRNIATCMPDYIESVTTCTFFVPDRQTHTYTHRQTLEKVITIMTMCRYALQVTHDDASISKTELQ